MNKIRAAVVGAGIYGKHHMNAYRHNPDTVLVAICDTDTERCDDLAMAYGIQATHDWIGYYSRRLLISSRWRHRIRTIPNPSSPPCATVSMYWRKTARHLSTRV